MSPGSEVSSPAPLASAGEAIPGSELWKLPQGTARGESLQLMQLICSGQILWEWSLLQEEIFSQALLSCRKDVLFFPLTKRQPTLHKQRRHPLLISLSPPYWSFSPLLTGILKITGFFLVFKNHNTSAMLTSPHPF